MKKQFLLIGLALILGTFPFCSRSGKTSVNVSIKDYTEKEIVLDINNQNKGDAYIFKTNFFGEGYKVIMFHDYSGKLQMYDCFYGTDEIFSEANLSWKNDTTLIVTLINTELNNKISFEFFGNGSRSGMSCDE